MGIGTVASESNSAVESTPSKNLKGITDENGYEWTNHDGVQWHRVIGSGDAWTKL